MPTCVPHGAARARGQGRSRGADGGPAPSDAARPPDAVACARLSRAHAARRQPAAAATASTGASVCCASCCRWCSSCSIGGRAAGPGRLAPATSLRIGPQQQTRDIDLPAHRGAILDPAASSSPSARQRRRCMPRHTCSRTPRRPAKKLCPALQITRSRAACARWRASSDHKSGFAYVARQVDPQLAAARPCDLDGCPASGAYTGGGAHLPDERARPSRSSASPASTTRASPAWSSSTTSSSAAGPATRSSCRTRPGARCARCARRSRRPGQDVRLTIDEEIQYTAEHVLSGHVRRPRQGRGRASSWTRAPASI